MRAALLVVIGMLAKATEATGSLIVIILPGMYFLLSLPFVG